MRRLPRFDSALFIGVFPATFPCTLSIVPVPLRLLLLHLIFIYTTLLSRTSTYLYALPPGVHLPLSTLSFYLYYIYFTTLYPF
jgi:hypothetical protein